MLGYLSVKDQSVAGVVTTSPVSHRPARRSLGSSPTTRSTMSATSSTATIAPTTIKSFLIFPLYRSAFSSFLLLPMEARTWSRYLSPRGDCSTRAPTVGERRRLDRRPGSIPGGPFHGHRPRQSVVRRRRSAPPSVAPHLGLPT